MPYVFEEREILALLHKPLEMRFTVAYGTVEFLGRGVLVFGAVQYCTGEAAASTNLMARCQILNVNKGNPAPYGTVALN